MNYRKQLAILTSIAALVFIVTAIIGVNVEWSSCVERQGRYFSDSNLFLRCLEISIFGEPQQYISFISLSILLSLTPLFFLKEAVYRAWRKFAIIYLPIAIFIIIFGTTSSSGGFGPSMAFTKEIASVWLSALFLIISIGIMVVKTWKLWGKGEDGENVPVHKKDNSEL